MPAKLDDWYDYPEFYDLAFEFETTPEADFLEQIWNKYVKHPVKRILEPACGSGRQIIELAARGYDVVGFDLNERSVEFAQKKLNRRKRKGTAEVFVGDMTNFEVSQPVDAAYCMINTFRHLTTDQLAYNHLVSVGNALAPAEFISLAFI